MIGDLNGPYYLLKEMQSVPAFIPVDFFCEIKMIVLMAHFSLKWETFLVSF